MADPDTEKLAEEIARLREVVDARLADDPVRQAAFNRLHEELRTYKEGFLESVEKPLLIDLIQLYDLTQWFARRLETDGITPEQLADGFQVVIDELLDVLYRRDVVPMEPVTSFDPSRHRAIKAQPAADASADNQIAEVLKRGFMRRDRALRPEEVVVYKWKATSRQG